MAGIRLKSLSVSTAEIYNLPLDKIAIDPAFNVRHDSPELRAHLQMLRDSMIADGFLRTKPVVVRLTGETATLVDGHCRIMAARMAVKAGAEIVAIPCVSEGRGVGPEDRTLLLLTSNNGLPLSSLEQAEAVKRLLKFGWSENDIGKKIGKTRQHIANLLELAGAPIGVKAMVVGGTLAATEAVKTIRAEGANAEAVLTAAAKHAEAAGKPKVTAKTIAAVSKPKPRTETVRHPDPAPIRFLPKKIPLSVAAEHVVTMAKGERLPDGLRRAIDALHESLS